MTLHLYAQPHEHAEAWVCGTRDALVELRDALTAAIESRAPASCHVFANDGEGYAVVIVPARETEAASLATPYGSILANRRDGRFPFELMSLSEYRRLARGGA